MGVTCSLSANSETEKVSIMKLLNLELEDLRVADMEYKFIGINYLGEHKLTYVFKEDSVVNSVYRSINNMIESGKFDYNKLFIFYLNERGRVIFTRRGTTILKLLMRQYGRTKYSNTDINSIKEMNDKIISQDNLVSNIIYCNIDH